MNKDKTGIVLISACLMGEPVRYDGRDQKIMSAVIDNWRKQGCLVPLCPEILGGLPVPRPPVEIAGGEGADVLRGRALALGKDGTDYSRRFIRGACRTLELGLINHVALAVLTDRSPSCGSTCIYNGEFTGQRIPGAGVTAALLRQNDILVFSPDQLEQAEMRRRS